jgi:hypothetical protein
MDQLQERIKQSCARFENACAAIHKQSLEANARHREQVDSAREQSRARAKQAGDLHDSRLSSFGRDFQAAKDQFSKAATAFEKKSRENCAQYQSSLSEIVRTLHIEQEKRRQDWLTMSAFYDEKIGVLSQKRESAMRVFNDSPSRQSEIDIITKLEGLCQTKMLQLNNAVSAYQDCKKLLVKQEKEGNRRFGKGPKVGTLAARATPLSH